MSVRRPWAALFAALLFLAPLAAGAHVHPSHADQACAACVVTHHAPAVRADATAFGAPTILAATWVASTDGDTFGGEPPVHTGRGPPAFRSRSVL